MVFNATVSNDRSAKSSETATVGSIRPFILVTCKESNGIKLEEVSKVLCGLGRVRFSVGKQHENPSSRNSEAKYLMHIGHLVLLSEVINILGRPVAFE